MKQEVISKLKADKCYAKKNFFKWRTGQNGYKEKIAIKQRFGGEVITHVRECSKIPRRAKAETLRSQHTSVFQKQKGSHFDRK